jgi:hypothetical protein
MSDFDQLGATRTYVRGYNGVNWYRNIIWNKEKFFLVIDQVEAVEPGDYRIQAVFRTLDDNKPEVGADRVRAQYGGRDFCLVSASQTPLKITGTTPPTAVRHAIVESKAKKMPAGHQESFMNLLYSSHDHQGWLYDIDRAGCARCGDDQDTRRLRTGRDRREPAAASNAYRSSGVLCRA